MSKLKDRLKTVERSLKQQAEEQKKRERAMKLVERESLKCKNLESNIQQVRPRGSSFLLVHGEHATHPIAHSLRSQLKHSKAEMIRKQKDSTTRFKEFMESKNREVNKMRKSCMREQKKNSKIQTENKKLKSTLDRKERRHEKVSRTSYVPRGGHISEDVCPSCP